MTTSIIIPADDNQPLVHTDLYSLHDYQVDGDGLVEAISLKNPPVVILCDKEWKIKRRQQNRRATALSWLFGPNHVAGEMIRGTVVLVGARDNDGNATDVPADLVSLLLSTKQYKILYKGVESKNGWIEDPDTYDDFFTSALLAVSLVMRSPVELAVRVEAV